MARSKGSIVAKPSARFADRGKGNGDVVRVPFGLGEAPGTLGAAEKCLRCSFGNVPVVEEVVWTIPLPLNPDDALATFGDTVNLLSGSSSVPGVASIDSTFLINGILQTDILAQGIGVHVFCEPMSFSTIGNAFLAPGSPGAYPPSPDVYTANDAANGAVAETPTTPAVFEWGAATWRAGWNFINAYQFQWKANQRELVLNELAADVSYFGSFADAEASGTSEVPVIEFVAAVNAQYRALDASTIFMPVNFRRVGSVGGTSSTVPVSTTLGGLDTNNVGIFHPTRDFDLAPVTWGGLRWQGYGCRGQMYRQVESPCFLERGIPIGMQFIVQDAVHQAQMFEALTINNEPFGQNVLPDENVGNSGFTLAGGRLMVEQTLDTTPFYVSQSVQLDRQVFKGGILKIGIKIKGWEMPGGWKTYCQENLPKMMRHGAPAA